MRLYRLTVATLIQRKVWIIVLLCLLGLPLALPYLTPYETNPTLIEPARAQVAWVSLWVLAVFWILYQAASFGDHCVRMGLGAYFLSSGMSGFKQMLQMWLACMTFILPMLGVTLLVCLLGAMPGSSEQASEWIIVNFQYAFLFLLVLAPIVLLSISLGSRFGATVGYIIPLFLVGYGAYGVGYVDMLAQNKPSALLDWVYTLSPHVHLADLTPRLVFKQGSMAWGEFAQIVAYFVGLKLILSTVSYAGFRVKPLA